MKNIIVYGSRFGQFYLEALKRMKGIKIVGLLAKGSDRSYECARYYNIPLYTSLDEVEERVDVACVAVKTGALGGEGANIAKQLLRKGINVLLEQPVHYKELGECYKIAQNQKVYFGVGNLYLNLPAVQNFIRNVHIVSKTEKIAYINVDLATQVSYPVISILGEVLQTLRPWENVGSICGHVPFQTETVKIGDIPISFRAHNEIEKENIDGFLHMLFRISVGFAGGQLTLFDPDGPVIWNPRIHFPDENIIPGRLEFHSPLNMDEQNSFILYSSEKKQKMIFKDEWPCAIAKDIEKTVVEPTEPTLQYIQRILNNSHAWQLLMKGLGYPEIVSGSFYSYYPSEKLLRESTSLFEKSSALLIEYLKIDINNDFVSDKIKEDSVDIVIAVGVLNNAKNIEVTLKNIKKVLKKDGKVIIVEAIGESVQMLISQAFMMQEPDDARAEKNETFLKLYQWHELFQKVGFAVEKSLPTIDSELCVYNQKVFVLSCQLEDKYSGSK